MNRAQLRASGIKGTFPILTITQEQIDQHMPGVNDGDVIQIRRNGQERVMRVRVTAPAEPIKLAS